MKRKLRAALNWLRPIAMEFAELPGLRVLGKPVYRWMFSRPYYYGNAYYGVFDSRAQALAAAPALPTTYDQPGTGDLYLERHQSIRVSDYPMVHWMSKLLADGRHRVFDLGGHIGVTYYGFRRYLSYPETLQWCVHDVPSVVEAGLAWAEQYDPEGLLRFADKPDAASGHDVLISSGALQYLEYTLPELLARLEDPPPHVLVNMTPIHPSRSYITLQNMGKAVLPYRVMGKPELVAAMTALGYTVADQWQSKERNLSVPFEPDCALNYYSGFYFKRT